MIKIFKGLGDVVNNIFGGGGKVTTAPVKPPPVITTRPSQPLIGHIQVPHVATPVVVHAPPPPPFVVPPPPLPPVPQIQLPGPVDKIQFQRPHEIQQPIATVIPATQPQVFSAESPAAPYETLYTDFHLEAIPFYNFWTADETTNDKDPRGDRKLEDCPRFIKVVWEPAPEMPRNFDDHADQISHRFRDMRPVKFGLQIAQPALFRVKGVEFYPDHLQPHNFSMIRKSLANGYIGPGAVDGIVEVPVQNVSPVSYVSQFRTSHVHRIDEDAFLLHPDMHGIAFHELKTNIHQLTNGVLGSAAIAHARLSPTARLDSAHLFAGKFAVNRTPFGGGNLQIHSVHPSSPSLSIISRIANPRGGEIFDHVIDTVRKVVESPATTDMKRSLQAKVKFIHPALDGAVQPERVNMMTRPEHAEAMVAMAHALPHLEMFSRASITTEKRRAEIPSFSSPRGLKPIDYVGYVLEKYRRNSSGVFVKEEEIEMPSRDYTEYYDTKIRYGEVYRYRVRAILRWTRPSNVGPFGIEPLTIARPGNSTTSVAPFKSSYFAGEWSHQWAYATVLDTQPPPPPDELQVRPESAKQRICVSYRVPENSQKDIYAMILYRKLIDGEGRDLTGWTPIHRTGLQNVLYYDTNVQYFQDMPIRYCYAAVCVSRHDEVSTLSEQIAGRLNREYRTKGELPSELVSCRGVKFEHVGAFSVYPIRRSRSEVVVSPQKSWTTARFTFTGRNAFGSMTMGDSKYWVRIESLDTGEKLDMPLQIKYRNLPNRIDHIVNTAFLPPAEQKIREIEAQRAKEIQQRAKMNPFSKHKGQEFQETPYDRIDPGSRKR